MADDERASGGLSEAKIALLKAHDAYSDLAWDEVTGAQYALPESIRLDELVDDTLRPAVQLLLDAIGPLSDDDIAAIPEPVVSSAQRGLANLSQALGAARSLMKRSRGRSPHEVTGERVSIRETCEANIHAYCTSLAPFLVSALARHHRVEEQLEEIAAAKRAATGALKKAKASATRIGELETRAEKAIADAATAATLHIASAQSKAFDEQAKQHGRWAKVWLWVGGLAAFAIAGSVVAAIVLGSSPPLGHESWMIAANLSYYSARALLMSVLSYVMVAGLRNYRAATHNRICYEQRASVLATYNAFVESISEHKVADVVHLQAMQAIFSVPSTGYGDGAPAATTHVAELLNHVKSPGAQ